MSGGRTLRGDRNTTASTPSSNEATTVIHRSSGAGTRARWDTSTPSSAAVTRPRSGRPTTAHHDPSTVARASRARASEVAPPAGPLATVIVLPRRIPPPGIRPERAGTTSSRCSPARDTGRTRRASSAKGIEPAFYGAFQLDVEHMFGLSEDSLRNATDWLARISGTSAGQARAVL